MQHWQDEELVQALSAGHTAALDELYARYASKLYVFCRNAIPARYAAEAEDLVQEVFLRVIKAAQRFDPAKASFRTWLYRIARNCCIDFGRRKSGVTLFSLGRSPTQTGDAQTPSLEETLPDPTVDLESQVLSAALAQTIRECIQALQDTQEKQALLLYILEDKVYREIAEILGQSLSTARNRVKAAQQQVKRCLEKRGFFGG
ncbi:MAG: RNA polymerase sigma factor [Anaerolineales bacterium]|nr:RNA polymerase sigma factor [Anaerolineales bacterium]